MFFYPEKELQLKQLKHKQLPPQIRFATLTHDNQIKPVQYLVKHETALPSQKNICHPTLVDFEKDQFSIPINDKRENIINKPQNSFFFEAVEPFRNQVKKAIKQNNKTLPQQSAILKDTAITVNDDPIEKKILEKDDLFPLIHFSFTFRPPLESIMTLKMKIYDSKLLLKQIHL